MNTFIKILLSSLFIICTPLISSSAEMSLDQLVQKIKEDQKSVGRENAEREQRFIKEKDQRQKMLAQAKVELAALEKISARLQKDMEANEKQLTKLEGDLNIAKGVLGEMFGVVRQVSGDLKGQLQNSVVSAEITDDRIAFSGRLAETKALPSTADLERLWFELQREMTESGKITHFDGPVVLPDGKKNLSKITRVGSFNLVADGSYLSYQSETGQVLKLPRQPSGEYTSLISDIEEAADPVIGFGIDPSRGAILGMLVETPSLFERLQQGGTVGYIILIILAIGLAIVGERWVALRKADKSIHEQMVSGKIDPSNPLGKIIGVFEQSKTFDLESLELKLDEAILKATAPLTKGMSTLKVLSGVAPLLGLLGTVTGMILTFQSITLFGTGDPKLMAGGISQALITTVLGLVCAIPLLILHNWLSNKSQQLVQILEEQSAGLIAARSEKSSGVNL